LELAVFLIDLYGEEVKLNLGYRFDAKSWGKGYATELSFAAIEFGFDQLNTEEIFAIVRPGHLASIKVLEKCEMVLFDKLNDVEGQAESLVYKITKPDYLAKLR
jgi:ribosomal-protein-alanine N-acetyltransferase